MPVLWERWVGQVLDGFPLVQHLGGSASSAVYLTNRRINGIGHKAAIRITDAGSPGADFRFSRWQSAAQLSHPHLIRLFSAGRFELNGIPLFYAVMEFAEENLSQLLPSRPLTPAEARDMLEPTLEALAYLHRQGFVHGAIRPGNIMAINDQLKLAADTLYRSGDRAQPDSSSYNAPESAQDGAISPAADVWSLGVTLVEALTQHLPPHKTADQGEPILPQILPEVFHDIAQHCLKVDPAQRWTVSDISARLNPAAPVRTAFAAPVEAAAPQPSSTRRWLAAAALVLAFVILIGWLMTRRHQGPSRSDDVGVLKPSPPAAASPEKPSPAIEPQSSRSGGIANKNSTPPGNSEVSKPASATGESDNPDIVHQVIPNVPRSARNTITGRVKVGVKVNVDEKGNVSGAELANPGPSQYFARLAIEAARQWRFQAAQEPNREWTLRFEFGRSGTTVHPARGSQ